MAGAINMSEKRYVVYKHIAPNGKVYIGITSKKPQRRWGGGCGYANNDHFYRAILKYGWINFQHEILFENLTKEDAEQKEIELIAFYKSDQKEFGYNIQHGGSSNGKHSEEAKRKISEANKGRLPWNYGKHHSEKTKEKISESHKGMHLSEETKRKIALVNTGKKQSQKTIKKRVAKLMGHECSPETRAKISQAQKGKVVVVTQETKDKISKTLSIPVVCVETGVVYYGISDASRQTGLQTSSITRCCKGQLKQTGGYHWKYADSI